MGTLTLWLGSHVPSAVQAAVITEATQQWPDIAWQIEQAHEVHGVWPGPTLAVLAPDDPLPPLDPADGAVVWVLEHEANPGRPLVLASTLRAHIGRLIAPRQGEPPSRAYVLPTHLSRAALLRLPRPEPQPLPRVPRVSADGCLHAQGCRACTAVCRSEALSFSAQAPVIQADRCQQCGACVAACPTGSLQSATVGDKQWRGLIDGLRTAESPVSLTLECVPVSESPAPGVHLTVGCIGELGWAPLWAWAAAGLPAEQLILSCPDHQCPQRPAAAATQARWDRIRRLVAQSGGPKGEDSADDEVMRLAPVHGPIDPETARWPELVQAVRMATQGISVDVLRQPDKPPLGYRVTLTSTEDRTCTLCEGCVNRCAPQALRVEKNLPRGTRRLRVEASRCLGCGACVAACSEQVLAVEPDQSMMAVTTTEWTTLFADEVLRCLGCGAPLESAPFIHHVASTLRQHGFDAESLRHLQYCPGCKDQQLFAPMAH